MTRTRPPALGGILETVLYVDDLEPARSFYADVMGLGEIFADARMAGFNAGDDRVLLLFKRGASAAPAETPGGTIPPHDGAGPVHIAFALSRNNLKTWEDHLVRHGVEIESRVAWPAGDSLYFRDPDGHLVELAPRRLWGRK